MRDRFKLILLLLLGLALYLPSLGAGYFVLDDIPLVRNVMAAAEGPLGNPFRYSAGTYYRPIMGISYLLDAHLWAMKPALMHFENVLIHAINALLVFAVTRRLLRGTRSSDSELPLLAAALFTVSPLCTESVNWISGRSDPLASLFALTATWLFVAALQRTRHWLLWPAALAALVGSLAKEVAFAVFPCFIVALLLSRPGDHGLFGNEPGRRWRIIACLPFLSGAAGYWLIRSAAFVKRDLGTGMLAETFVGQDQGRIWSHLDTMVTAFGFYLKKLVFPFPLSFAIDRIDPAYFWVGAAAILPLLALLLRRNRQAVLVLLLLLPIGPALLVAVAKFAFLPAYAERYLYLSTAFLAITLACAGTASSRARLTVTALLCLLIAVYLPATVRRNLLWADSLALLESIDVASLEHPSFWNAYCVTLADRGQYDRARTEFIRLHERHPLDQTAVINLAEMELYIGSPSDARSALEPFFNGEIVPEEAALATMIKVNEARLAAEPQPDGAREMWDELVRSRLNLFEETSKPGQLLEAAESALAAGNSRFTAELIDRMRVARWENRAQNTRAMELLERLGGLGG